MVHVLYNLFLSQVLHCQIFSRNNSACFWPARLYTFPQLIQRFLEHQSWTQMVPVRFKTWQSKREFLTHCYQMFICHLMVLNFKSISTALLTFSSLVKFWKVIPCEVTGEGSVSCYFSKGEFRLVFFISLRSLSDRIVLNNRFRLSFTTNVSQLLVVLYILSEMIKTEESYYTCALPKDDVEPC